MKSFLSALSLLLLMTVLAWGSYLYVDTTTHEFSRQAYHIESLCMLEEYQQAALELEDFDARWQQTSRIYYTFLPHDGVLEVSFCVHRLKAYLMAQDRALILSGAAQLRLQVYCILSDEMLDSANLL
ncbi:MAG: DUF4363 family protein [Eubacteriales bacterium]|jgi:hypothetical protein